MANGEKITAKKLIEEAFDSLIEDYGFNTQNGYVTVDDDGNVDEFWLECNNNTTALVFKMDCIKDILRIVSNGTKYFNADEEFDELWSDGFGYINGFSPSSFMQML